jgi:hypothetical protein
VVAHTKSSLSRVFRTSTVADAGVRNEGITPAATHFPLAAGGGNLDLLSLPDFCLPASLARCMTASLPAVCRPCIP